MARAQIIHFFIRFFYFKTDIKLADKTANHIETTTTKAAPFDWWRRTEATTISYITNKITPTLAEVSTTEARKLSPTVPTTTEKYFQFELTNKVSLSKELGPGYMSMDLTRHPNAHLLPEICGINTNSAESSFSTTTETESYFYSSRVRRMAGGILAKEGTHPWIVEIYVRSGTRLPSLPTIINIWIFLET